VRYLTIGWQPGKITKWAIELIMYDIVYKPKIAIKAQA
jgi:hypothetical protein